MWKMKNGCTLRRDYNEAKERNIKSCLLYTSCKYVWNKQNVLQWDKHSHYVWIYGDTFIISLSWCPVQRLVNVKTLLLLE